ncbi:MAG TPA: hypothetical protein VK577_00520 [Bradyrhizobium sp.]|jgi:hypothetical protein|nr:hypothetical protein [Bradyrhizobium sp.]
MVRLYRPRPEILNGKWKFPVPQPTSLPRAAKWETNFMRQVLPRRTIAGRAKI